MIAEYLHTGLSVGVISGLESQLLYAKFGEELIQNSNKITKCQSSISNNT